jgi:hypothetical protein
MKVKVKDVENRDELRSRDARPNKFSEVLQCEIETGRYLGKVSEV